MKSTAGIRIHSAKLQPRNKAELHNGEATYTVALHEESPKVTTRSIRPAALTLSDARTLFFCFERPITWLQVNCQARSEATLSPSPCPHPPPKSYLDITSHCPNHAYTLPGITQTYPHTIKTETVFGTRSGSMIVAPDFRLSFRFRGLGTVPPDVCRDCPISYILTPKNLVCYMLMRLGWNLGVRGSSTAACTLSIGAGCRCRW